VTKLKTTSGHVDDAGVSDVYRGLATERAPDELNKRVLRAAAEFKTTGPLRSARWMRPLAWAASIVLCVTFVYELGDPQLLQTTTSNEFSLADAPIVEDAAAIARLHKSPGQALSAGRPQAGTGPDILAGQESARIRCTQQEQSAPESWYACIVRLEKDGWRREAEQQQTELETAYPEFEIRPARR
jgi:hypothetical protein